MVYIYDVIEFEGGWKTLMGGRFFRIYPLHLVMLLCFLGYEVLKLIASRYISIPDPAFGRNSIGAFFLNLFLLNGVGIAPPSFNAPSWSISVEFLAYCVFSFVAVRSRRCTSKKRPLGFFCNFPRQPNLVMGSQTRN